LDLPSLDGKAAQKIVPPRLRIPWWKGLGADSEEKRDPASDINTKLVESLKVLDPNRPIREADVTRTSAQSRVLTRFGRVGFKGVRTGFDLREMLPNEYVSIIPGYLSALLCLLSTGRSMA
jgi:hypothetical protein